MQKDTEAKAMFRRLRHAAAAFAEGGAASSTEAMNAFVESWDALRKRLEQRRMTLPYPTKAATVAAIRAYLKDIGLEGHATVIIDSKSIQTLHNRLGTLLALDGWTRATLQAAGEALEQEKAQRTKTLASLSEICIATPDLAPDVAPAQTKAAERVKELNGLLERHDEAMHLRNATVDAQIPQFLQSLRQVEALAVKHENAILAL